MFKRCALLSACIAASLLPMLPASDANAEPIGFRRPRAYFDLGIEVFDAVTGTFGNAADVGMSFFADAGLQIGGYFGINVRFGSARAFTNKDFLPFDDGYQYIYLTASPRFNWAPLRKMHLAFFIQPDISMQIFESNTLVTLTGNDAVTGAAGGSVGAQAVFGIVTVSAQFTALYNWNVQSVILGGSIAVGLTGSFDN